MGGQVRGRAGAQDPSGLRARVAAATGGAYPAAVRAAMAAFDVVEAIAVARTSLCTPGAAPLTRIQVPLPPRPPAPPPPAHHSWALARLPTPWLDLAAPSGALWISRPLSRLQQQNAVIKEAAPSKW